MSEKPENTKAKKPYQKPSVNQVNLVLTEAVLQSCKTSAGDTSGKTGASGGFTCSAAPCKTEPYGS